MYKKSIHPDGRNPRKINCICGVYAIVHIPTKRRYVGSSSEVQKRLYLHVTVLRRNKHHAGYLQNVWNKHKEDEFKFFLLEECELDKLADAEQKHMDATPKKQLMNSHPTARSARGFKFSEETIEKMSVSAKKVASSQEERRRRSERCKQQHQEGRIGTRKRIMPIRICKCGSAVQQLIRSTGQWSQFKMCPVCKATHVARYGRIGRKHCE